VFGIFKECIQSILAKDLVAICKDKASFWRLSLNAHIPAMLKGVMALLWVMRCPKGLIGQNSLNPERE
jgi:hypothetical protein